MIEHLIGDGARDFRRGATWPDRAALYRSAGDWFRTIAALPIFTDPEEWLDRAPELRSFKTPGLLSRSDAKRRHQEGESVYLLGLDRADRQLRDWCDALSDDLAVTPGSVSVQAWTAGTATEVAMHYDHDFNFNLQLVGCKQWQTAQNDLVANPVRSYHTARASGVATDSGRDMPTGMPKDAQTWTAEPGDLVWLPQGTWHATRTEESSVAMAFVVRPATWGDLTRHRQLR
jgi:ribosomal protein L16 Arg81 hydroxylase